MGHTIHHQPGYPFSLELSIEYSLTDDGLHVQTTATNIGREACPYGCGAHPYLTLGTATVDPLLLRVPARTVWLSDERDLPAGSEPVAGTEYDFRSSRPVGSTVLDNCFTDLERDEDGLARVVLSDPEGGRALDALGRRELPLPDGLHRRPAPRRATGAALPSSP